MKRKRRQNRRRRHSPAALTHKVPVRLSRPRVTIDPGCAWFAVWTEPRGERRVMAGLERAGFPCYLPSLADKAEMSGNSDAELHKVITEGQKTEIGNMPPMGKKFKPEEITDIVNYVRTLVK